MKRYPTLAAFAAGLLAAIAGASAAMAQDAYPSRRVTVVVPSPAGSTTNSLARLVADQLQRKWGQTVIVENNGRGLNFGAEQVSRAPADGYTLLVTAPMPLTFANLLYRDINYQASEFVPVSLLAKIPNVLAVRKSLAGEERERAGGVRQGQSGQDHLCVVGRRIDRASERRAIGGPRRHQDDARALSRLGARDQRPLGRPCRPVLRHARRPRYRCGAATRSTSWRWRATSGSTP